MISTLILVLGEIDNDSWSNDINDALRIGIINDALVVMRRLNGRVCKGFYVDDIITIRKSTTDDKKYWNSRAEYFEVLFAEDKLRLDGVPLISKDNIHLESIYPTGSNGSMYIPTMNDYNNKLKQEGYLQAQKDLYSKEQIFDAVNNLFEWFTRNKKSQVIVEDKLIEFLNETKRPKVEITLENNIPIKATLV